MDGGVRWARLADIAAHADVSEATVSRVLAASRGSPSTRQAVLTALDVLGYDRPSRLRRKSVGLVSLIVPELSNPIFPAFAQIIETTLARNRFTPVLCTQTPGRSTRRVRPDAARPGGRHRHLRLGPARRHLRAPSVAPSCASTVCPSCCPATTRASTRPSSPTTRSPRWTSRSPTLVALGPQIGLAVGPDRYVPVIRKIRVPGRDEVARGPRRRRGPHRARCSPSRAGTPPPHG